MVAAVRSTELSSSSAAFNRSVSHDMVMGRCAGGRAGRLPLSVSCRSLRGDRATSRRSPHLPSESDILSLHG